MGGQRHLWWNFVSSSKERIKQAKNDWLTGRFGRVPGETEFIFCRKSRGLFGILERLRGFPLA
jgi:hypothetical protein